MAQVKDLLPESLQGEAGKVAKGTDTMDVWFDSGSSWAGVTQQHEALSFPADLYLEGSDQHRCALASAVCRRILFVHRASMHSRLWDSSVQQPEPFASLPCAPHARRCFLHCLQIESTSRRSRHSAAKAQRRTQQQASPCRGWFQSSLLTAVATSGTAPYRAILTHGFVLDEKGTKMSKSLGNTIDPFLIIEGGKNEKQDPAYGADVLRLWVASVDYSADVSIGSSIMKQVFDAYRKLRGTLRFMLGNVHDFDPAVHDVAAGALPLMDRYMLHCYARFARHVAKDWDSHNFGAIYRALNTFIAAELSAFYFELGKDRLYVRARDAPQRRSCQSVLRAVLQGLLATLAPITPHMCEDAWQALPARPAAYRSVFQAGLPRVDSSWELAGKELQLAEHALAVKDIASRALEKLRATKAIGAGLDARVAVHVEDEGARAALRELNAAENGVDNLKYICIASQVDIVDAVEECEHAVAEEVQGAGKVTASVFHAAGARCERCWHWSERVGESAKHPALCERCVPVVQELGFELPVKAEREVAAAAA